MIIRLIQSVGFYAIHACIGLGSFALFFIEAVQVMFTTKPKYSKIMHSMYVIGVQSLTITVLTGTFTGMVFALQSYVGFSRVGGEQFIGVIVALGVIRELGPMLTGLMVTGRAGSALAAEIGIMSIGEQIEALKTLSINVFQYLIVPRMIAGTLIFPFLTIFAMICGIVGGYLICVYVLLLSSEDYVNSITMYVNMHDIAGGLIKASVFGFILTLVGCYKGYHTTGGARGVGIATMQTVVTSSVMILISNYFLTKLLEAL